MIGVIAVRFYALHGILNSMLSAVGLGFIKTNMLGSTHQALAALAITLIWSQLGTNTIIFITGLAALDPSLAEAARVDGAGALRVYWRIIIPQLMRFIQFAFIITVLTAFTAIFSLIFVMTGGGPDYGSTTLEFYVYQQAFGQAAFGTGALLGVLLFVLVAGDQRAAGADLAGEDMTGQAELTEAGTQLTAQQPGTGSSGASATRRRRPLRPMRVLLFADHGRCRRGHAVPVAVHRHDLVQEPGSVRARRAASR